ncbi:MAG: YjdF family protein [Lachnospiraceae bacterium]|nr:YjdF family protein [Lachnospiraceae bacterium]
MEKVTVKMTLLFDEPFWIGVFEKVEHDKLTAAKVTFGSEPKDYEVFDFVLKHYMALEFSPAVTAVLKKTKKNPKRMQRDIKKQFQDTGIGTKSQQALKLQQEQCKTERRRKSHQKKEEEAERMFELKQQKKKDKHRGH